MADDQSLVSIAEASRILQMTRRQIEAAIRGKALATVQFNGSRARYVRVCEIQTFRTEILKT